MHPDFEKLRGSLSIRELPEHPGLTFVSIGFDCNDWDAFEEADLYEWHARFRVALRDGGERVVWTTGHHDMCPFLDMLPHAGVWVPSDALTSPVDVVFEGWVEIEERVDFRFRFDRPREDLAFESCDDTVTIVRSPLAASPIATEALSLPGGPCKRPRAVLPGVGILEGDPGSLALRTREGRVPLAKLDAWLESLPGRHHYSGPSFVGGPDGLLAVHVLQEPSFEKLENHVVVMRVPTCETVLDLGGLDGGTAAGDFPGRFAPDGSTYACLVRYPPRSEGNTTYYENAFVGVSLSTGKPVTKWKSPLGSPRERWEWIGDTFWHATSSSIVRTEPGAEPVRRRVPGDADARACAHHPSCGVTAWLAESWAPSRTDVSLVLAHAEWGMVELPLPGSAFGGSLAVLPDGRVVLASDELFVLRPPDGTLTSLGAAAGSGERLCLTSDEGETWLWTSDPERFAIRIP